MKNTIKGNFVGFTNGDPTITNSKDTIKEMTNNKQQTEINAVGYLGKVKQFARENNPDKPKQQTAIEWLFDNVYMAHSELSEKLKQAKEMEKERLTDAYCDGKANGMDISHPLSLTKEISANDWYNETYGGGEQ